MIDFRSQTSVPRHTTTTSVMHQKKSASNNFLFFFLFFFNVTAFSVWLKAGKHVCLPHRNVPSFLLNPSISWKEERSCKAGAKSLTRTVEVHYGKGPASSIWMIVLGSTCEEVKRITTHKSCSWMIQAFMMMLEQRLCPCDLMFSFSVCACFFHGGACFFWSGLHTCPEMRC